MRAFAESHPNAGAVISFFAGLSRIGGDALRKNLVLLAIGPIALSATGAYGQVAAADDQSEGSSSPALEEVVVTARRRTESLQSAPISITAMSAQELQKRSVQSFNDVSQHVPNLEINNGRVDGTGSTAAVFIRGLGQTDPYLPLEPGVGMYIDGVYVGGGFAGDFDFMGVDRVEVLRGPQGTLYGKNTIGGAVRILTSKPSGERKGTVEASVGRFDHFNVKGSIDFPITENFAGRLSAVRNVRDGYASNRIGENLEEQDSYAVSGRFVYEPSETSEYDLKVLYSSQNQDGAIGAMRRFWPGAVPDLINAFNAPGVAAEFGLQPPFDVYGEAWVNRIDDTDNFQTGDGSPTWDDSDIAEMSLRSTWVMPRFTLESITAYRDMNADVQRDGDHTPFNVFTLQVEQDVKQYSQEFRATGNAFDSKLNWIVGVFGMYQDGVNTFFAPLLTADIEQAVGLDISLDVRGELDSTSAAIFGEGTYYLTPDLGLTLGIRANYDDKEYTYQVDRIFTDVDVIPRVTVEESWTEILPRAVLEYQWTDDIMVYGSASQGYKAGGWNPRTLTPGVVPQAFDPETITTYEAGIKSTWFSGRMRLNAAAFFSIYEDIQLIAITTSPLQGGGETVDTQVVNGGEAEISGMELELSLKPADPLQLNFSLGLLDTEFTELDPEVTAISDGVEKDDDLVNAPGVNFSTSAEYLASLGRGNNGHLEFFVAGSYQGDTERSAQNFPDLKTEAFWLWNARVTYVPPAGNWQVALYGENLTDEIYLTSGADVRGLGITEAFYNEPRQWGVTFRYDF